MITASSHLRFRQTCRRVGVRLTRFILFVHVAAQKMTLAERMPDHGFIVRRQFRVSTSRFGTGQRKGSNCTPLGLHRIAQKIGGGWPSGAVFRSRRMVGYAWRGLAGAAITHRILWLEGLEPGVNRGGDVDTFARYIYIHGTGDEPTIGQPASRGCIHVAAADLIPLYDTIPLGTLVWISDR